MNSSNRINGVVFLLVLVIVDARKYGKPTKSAALKPIPEAELNQFLAMELPKGTDVGDMLSAFGHESHNVTAENHGTDVSSPHAEALVHSHRHQIDENRNQTAERLEALEQQLHHVGPHSNSQTEQAAVSSEHAVGPGNAQNNETHLPGFFSRFTELFQRKQDEDSDEDEEDENDDEDDEEEDEEDEEEDQDADFLESENATIVKKSPKGKLPGSVILVGNGKSLLRGKLGSRIDSFDVVGRYNYFKLKGHEAQVGRKTTLWFLGELKTPFSKEFDKSVNPQKYIVPCTWPATKGCKKCAPSGKQKKRVAGVRKKVISKWSKAGLADKLEIMEDSVQRELRSKYKFREQWPSTGIISMVYALRHYNAPIYITGFDFRGARKKDCSWTGCTSKILGHWFQKNYKSSTVHNMYAEGNFIKTLSKRGLIKVL